MVAMPAPSATAQENIHLIINYFEHIEFMKQVNYWILAAILSLCGTNMLTSCTSNDDNYASAGEKDQEHDAVDTYEGVSYSYPVYVAEGVSYDMKFALEDYLPNIVNKVDENTRMVVLSNYNDLDDATLEALYLNGAVIALENPSRAKLDAFFKDRPDWYGNTDDEDIDNAILYAFDENDEFIVQNTNGTDMVINDDVDDSHVVDADDSQTYDPVLRNLGIHNDIYKMIGPMMAHFAGDEQEELAAARALTRADDKDKDQAANLKNLAASYHKGETYNQKVDKTWRELWFSDPDVFHGICPITFSYTIYPIHVYQEEAGAGDYYAINMTAQVSNNSMLLSGYNGNYCGKYRVYHGGVRLRWCGAFGKSFKATSTLCKTRNPNDKVNVIYTAQASPSPETTVNEKEYTSTSSHGFGFGISGEKTGKVSTGKKEGTEAGWKVGANANFNWNWSESTKWKIADTDVTNTSMGFSPSWELKYNNLPKFKWSEEYGFDLGTSQTYRTLQSIHGTWIWYEADTPDTDQETPYYIHAEAEAHFGFMSFWGTERDLKELDWEVKVDDYLKLKPMLRYRSGFLKLKNDFTDKFISDIRVYAEGNDKPVVERADSYPAGSEINLGGFNSEKNIYVKFKAKNSGGQTDEYVYNLNGNKTFKVRFKDTVTLYASNDFGADK